MNASSASASASASTQREQQHRRNRRRRSGTRVLLGVCIVLGLLSSYINNHCADAFSTTGSTLATGIRAGRAASSPPDRWARTPRTPVVQRSAGVLRPNLFGRDDASDDATDGEEPSTDKSSASANASANKFDMAQRIESLKSVVLGALAGGFAVTPVAYLHYVFFAGTGTASTAQWEFATDMSSLEAALFAIVYRYAVRANDDNPMLNQGVVGAFVVVRTLANIRVTDTCQSIPLRCGPPLGYFDWNMIEQAVWGGLESAVLFGAASLAMEVAFKQKWISKFD